MLNSAENEIFSADKFQIMTIANFFLLNIAEHENFSAIVGIFRFIRENFMLA